MIRLTKTTVSSLIVVGLMSISASASAPKIAQPDLQRLEQAIQRAVIDQHQQTPLQQYREKLLALKSTETQKHPTAEELLPILHGLVTYNTQLSGAKWDAQQHKLAQEINQPVRAYWNTFRGNSFIEILDTYIPDNHGDSALAKLEYLVKQNLQTQEAVAQNKLLAETLPASFSAAHMQLRFDLAGTQKRDVNVILKSMVPLAQEYNKLYQNEDTRTLALQLNKTYFHQPLRAGFGRTVNVEELRYHYGLSILGGGDYIKPLPAGELRMRYNLTQEEAQALYEFFAHYYR